MTNEMNGKRPSPRRSLLDLAPLELDCMNTLWPMGEGTVRDIRDSLAERRPRAYTTIMTIMDRLARKGVVERRKVGRAYSYRPNLTVEDARAQALGQVLENFFAGSKEALLAQLGSSRMPARPDSQGATALRARAAAASASRAVTRTETAVSAPPTAAPALASSAIGAGASTEVTRVTDDERIDDTLL
ncbi:MAG: BlaI/MecI/CopY family transcriptional regulator [Candidatus Acidiferrales bacterium]